jgi:nicotinamide-nucleotide amidase
LDNLFTGRIIKLTFDETLKQKTSILLEYCRSKSVRLVAAESCTGGLVSSYLTSIPGSSDVVEGGLVTYSNSAKILLLGVSLDLLESHGAVSKEVACAMAEGAILQTDANVSVAITGVAGPDGGSKEKPVGLVYFGVAGRDKITEHTHFYFHGDRKKIQLDSVGVAIDLLQKFVEEA